MEREAAVPPTAHVLAGGRVVIGTWLAHGQGEQVSPHIALCTSCLLFALPFTA